ncbi:MAG: ABC transporter substrate-binding protein [Lachnospiraceae bacterium]|nr:ABC transporter substrate-binding protein [Lachnospiraceae bacterium]
MKKIRRAAACLLVSVLLAATLSGCGSSGRVLKVYNAGEYIDKSLLNEFERKYDCTVIYETFDSNESMYTKLMSGEEYDILIPSDYMIERLIREDYLQPINWDLLTNAGNLMASVMENAAYDEEHTYTVPYFWGTVGIIYDTTIVDEADLAQGWNLLRNTDYAGEIYMYDSERDSFMVALKALGYSMNTTDTAQLDEAYDWLVAQRDAMEPVYVGDDVIDNMISGNKAMAVVYSGDAAYMITENRNLNYFTPEEGTNIWYDCMVITKNCTDTELAHQFINFMLEDESALKNSEAVGYSSPVDSAFEEMRTTVYEGISAYEPRFGHPSDEVFGYQETELKKYLADLWTKVTAY